MFVMEVRTILSFFSFFLERFERVIGWSGDGGY